MATILAIETGIVIYAYIINLCKMILYYFHYSRPSRFYVQCNSTEKCSLANSNEVMCDEVCHN